ncbi:UDP-N-acetylmuramate dehydrogenase [Anaerosalibacter bizertensis]|uniref:UDP-N-acetylmuramate dehydrogenase n=1 Tax=Anaerosalibacter bizertensis TaxID=932217 RepID=UPI001C0EE6F2|nr:UDP-N-acetylmuramate dehydrogenase [Anaerosalibacter bizertensis]MBU5294559.1 UDP-N-acetylmuramate dehydrogenase [Anaerosalibacter bizertensis]MCG4581538.1 UDP-N-acetylmuramate dehydrogenase [Anaerosalibacter bizertensis]
MKEKIKVGVVLLDKKDIKRIFSDNENIGKVLLDEPMKNHTSFKIGGPADIMIIPGNEKELIEGIKICKDNNINYYIMGNGSNLLVSDKGIEGVVIKISEEFGDIVVNDTTIKAESGALLTVVSKKALKNSLTGLEFASGIPGSIGGAITMNAGAYGGEMKDIVTKVRCLNSDGNIVEYSNEEMKFRYRKSRVEEEGLIVLSVEMELEKGDYKTIEERMRELTEKRTSKQPLHLPSAGSTFKRPEGYFAGKLIDDSGLRGIRHGGAQVSEKHCGFIVNIDKATSEDVRTLIRTVQKIVKDNYGVELETELKIIGRE